jgi:hypothetical protein
MPRNREILLTVVDVSFTLDRKHTVVECIATEPGKSPAPRRFKMTLKGHVDVSFGDLIGFATPHEVLIHEHENAPGKSALMRGKVAELPALA